MTALNVAFKWIDRANLSAWVWSIVPATPASAAIGYLARVNSQPWWVVGLASALGFGAIAFGIAALRSNRVTSIQQMTFDELRARTRNEELARRLGERDAELAYDNEVALDAFDLNPLRAMGTGFRRQQEIQEARHKAKLRKIEMGED